MKLKATYSIFLLFSMMLLWNCSSDDDNGLSSGENTPPTCVITSPEDDSVFEVGETITIAVDAEGTDNNLEEVRFYVNEIGVSSVTSFPYNFEWDTSEETEGSYTIKAEAIDAENETASDEIVITLGGALTADFEADLTTVAVGETVSFTDLSSNNVTSWTWDFGDNTSSNEENPTHTYTEPGVYTVELTVENGTNSATETKTDYITVISPKNYFPLVIDNEWEYENRRVANDEVVESLETLNVASEQDTENGTAFFLNSTSDEAAVSFTSILSNGEVYKNENQLLLTGNVDIGIDQDELPDFDINFEDLVVYDSEAAEGSVMYSEDQEVELPEVNNITLNLNLNIESVSLGEFDSIEVDGTTYNDVIGSQFIVSMGVEATAVIPPLPVPITIEVLEFQEVVNATNYFANEVGLVQSETNLSVVFSDELNQIPNFDIEDIMVLIEQKILDYQVSLEE